MIESHLISWHVGFRGRNYILHAMIVVSVRPLHVHLGGELQYPKLYLDSFITCLGYNKSKYIFFGIK